MHYVIMYIKLRVLIIKWELMCGHYLINICVTTINIDLFIYLNGQKV